VILVSRCTFTLYLNGKERAMKYFLLSAVLAVTAMSVDVARLSAAPPRGAPATIDVTLPADAQLTIDGQSTRSTSDHRLFITPPLEAGKTFHYTFSAKFVREGKTITVEQNVFVRAGRETFVSLDGPRAAFAGHRLPGGDDYTDGEESEPRSYYYGPESPALAGAGGVRFAPAPTIVDLSGRPVPSGGFHPIHWGPDPSDPFYGTYGR
jgi:uncharacterized protein (TIGR03000 family)